MRRIDASTKSEQATSIGKDKRRAVVESRYDDLLTKALQRRALEKRFGRIAE